MFDGYHGLLCTECRGIGPHIVALGKSHGFSRLLSGTWGIFSRNGQEGP